MAPSWPQFPHPVSVSQGGRGLNLLDIGTLTQRTRGRKKCRKCDSGSYRTRREGDFSFSGPTLLVQVSIRGKERQNYCYNSKQAGKTALGEGTGMTKRKPGDSPCLFRFCFHETNASCLGWGTSQLLERKRQPRPEPSFTAPTLDMSQNSTLNTFLGPPSNSVNIKTNGSPLDAHKSQLGSLKNIRISGNRTQATGSFNKEPGWFWHEARVRTHFP